MQFKKQILKDAVKGKIFGVQFVKADGEPRTMACRIPTAPKWFTGTGKEASDETLAVLDLHKMQWRSFRFDRLYSVTCMGQTFINHDIKI